MGYISRAAVHLSKAYECMSQVFGRMYGRRGVCRSEKAHLKGANEGAVPADVRHDALNDLVVVEEGDLISHFKRAGRMGKWETQELGSFKSEDNVIKRGFIFEQQYAHTSVQ
eukprot:1159915-Pelagomonas_calceolata.AAC.5